MDKACWNQANSQPGADGLPYSTWARAGPTGVTTLLKCDRAIRAGLLPDEEFDESSAVFVPKGSLPHDSVEIIRKPLQTRPISFKNCDNKIIVSANVTKLEPQYSTLTHK